MLVLMAALLLGACGGEPDPEQARAAANAAQLSGDGQGCRRFFVAGKTPVVANAAMTQKTTLLCNRAYASYHSGIVRTPLWVAEELTAVSIKMGQAVPRIDDFHPDASLPADERAELKDYARSGYDRGHMAPDADMPTAEAGREAFALSNMIPQAPKLNRKSWADLEKSVRLQTRGGRVYVVTGPLFRGATLRATRSDGRVKVPTHVWKAVYAENRGATVFIATNSDAPQWTNMSVDQFGQVNGVDPFPGLAPQYRTVNGALDGSMANAGGAAGGAAAGPKIASDGKPMEKCVVDGVPVQADGMVRSPTTDRPITREDYKLFFNHYPTPHEYCA